VAKLLFPALKNKQKIKVVWFLNYFTFTKTKKEKIMINILRVGIPSFQYQM